MSKRVLQHMRAGSPALPARSLMAIALALAAAACSTVPARESGFGTFATLSGHDLYAFNDIANDPARYPCAAECSPAWTPLYANQDDLRGSGFTVMVRDDGNLQWAYYGRPIYFYAGRTTALAADPQMRAGLWDLVYVEDR